MERHIYTTAGALSGAAFAYALPHEHIFTETGDAPAHAFENADAGDVVRRMAPLLRDAKASGVTLMCEATPVGVGRRADIVTSVARDAQMPVAMATGLYREPWVTQKTRDMKTDDIARWMIRELEEGIEETGVRAGFIKIGTSPDVITEEEERLTRAAALASRATGALICSHTTGGTQAARQLSILAEEGVAGERFCWYHVVCEPDYAKMADIAQTGCFLCLDYAGEGLLTLVLKLMKDGFLPQILISMDSGWYNPRHPDGGDISGYTRLFDKFFPLMRRHGVTEKMMAAIAHDNVWSAFSR